MADEKDSKEKDMTKEYELLRKKYNLPDLKELDREFFVGKLDDTTLLLRSLIHKMLDRTDIVFKTLSDVVQPSESNLSSMCEAEVFSDDEKKRIFDLMKKLAFLHRDLIIKDFEYSDDAAAAAINKTFKEWVGMKKEVLKILEKLRDSWNNDVKSKNVEAYFG